MFQKVEDLCKWQKRHKIFVIIIIFTLRDSIKFEASESYFDKKDQRKNRIAT